MKRVAFIFILILVLAGTTVSPVSAQCAMCTVSAEQSVKNGNTQGKGLNSGILYLLAIPYLMISGIGVLWYLKYRKKSVGYVQNI
ncbi:MAG TPA: hypothetical protein VKB19_04715 [Pedobacter sp.]|nr:hypothetical protein [Pedobacter sp.]